MAEYYDATGQMESITVTGASGSVHELGYGYDSFGNLRTQTTAVNGATSSETFYYDDLHRLTQSVRSLPGGSAVIDYDYDPAGNLTLKSDYATSYDYSGASGPNAVDSVTKVGGGSVSFGYDANGNLTVGDGRSLTYTAFDRPATITAGGVTASFAYGADLSRYQQELSNGRRVRYVGRHFEIVEVGTAVDYRHYLGETAILSKTGDLNDAMPGVQYLLRDRLGSVVTVVDEAGAVDEVRGYDPFGKPRAGDWADKSPARLQSATTERGFTDHEHLDESELIHMNGRVYDYQLGRFLSVDPVIQAPGNSQSLNPYSYIMNNPLSGTDPTGYESNKEVENRTYEKEEEVSLGSRIAKDTGNVIATTNFTDGTSVKTKITPTNNGATYTSVGYNSDGSFAGRTSGSVTRGENGGSDQIGSLQQRDSGNGIGTSLASSGAEYSRDSVFAHQVLNHPGPKESTLGRLGYDSASGVDLSEADDFADAMINGTLFGQLGTYRDSLADTANITTVGSTAAILGAGVLTRGAVAYLNSAAAVRHLEAARNAYTSAAVELQQAAQAIAQSSRREVVNLSANLAVAAQGELATINAIRTATTMTPMLNQQVMWMGAQRQSALWRLAQEAARSPAK